jgi:putative serine protease PepD
MHREHHREEFNMGASENNGVDGKVKMGMGRRMLLCFAGGVAATSLAIGLAGPAFAANGTSTSSSSSSADSTTTSTTSTGTSQQDADLAETVAAKCVPSVGTVTTSVSTPTESGIGQGSCVVIDSSGYLITNYHVVEGATKVVVTLNDQTYDAEIVGSDPTSDIAVLKIDPGDTQLTAIEVGDSSDLAIGQWVMTIGTPKGMEQSVSTGIVSGLDRSTTYDLDTTTAYYPGLIQTDAMINAGSSGGALVNSDGQLVGITTISYTSTGDFAGIAEAIPSNYAISIARQIIETGVVSHPFLGVSTTNVSPQNYSDVSSQSYFGAYVTDVTSGSPAEQAGIQAGDIITAVDGEPVYGTSYLAIAIRGHSVGDTVTVTVERGGQEKDIDVTLGSDTDYGDSTAIGSSGSTSTSSSTGSSSSSSSESASSSSSSDSSGSSDDSGSRSGILSLFGGSDGSSEGGSGSSGSTGSTGSAGGSSSGSSNGYGYGYEDYAGDTGAGYGFGIGSGYGYGSDYGSGYGYGNYGSGYGYGSGTGTYGSGQGSYGYGF